jgi:hypothetical protein
METRFCTVFRPARRRSPRVEIDLFEFVLHLPCVIAGHLHEQLQRAAFKSDAEIPGLACSHAEHGLLPARFRRVRFVEDLDGGDL